MNLILVQQLLAVKPVTDAILQYRHLSRGGIVCSCSEVYVSLLIFFFFQMQVFFPAWCLSLCLPDSFKTFVGVGTTVHVSR